MSNQVDILSIDTTIRNDFQAEISRIHEYKEKLKELENSLDSTSIKNRDMENIHSTIESLKDYIQNLENETQYNFYVMNTVPLIEEYKSILKKPMKMSFMGRQKEDNSEKNEIISRFLEIAATFTKNNYKSSNSKQNKNIICNNCDNVKDFDILDGNIYVCNKCYSQQLILKYTSSYNDIDRVNISSKYMYDRKVHFRDCIKQYQGKQNSTIPDKIYNELIIQFENHHILNNEKTGYKRFENITKNHILLFLKELGYSNHYENVHLIHYNLTGIKPDDISYLEDQLLEDFDSLTNLYDKKFKDIDRKNFINTQYVLYQLLCRHKHKCKKEDFIVLKTMDRKFFHDEVCKILFTELGWNSFPYF